MRRHTSHLPATTDLTKTLRVEQLEREREDRGQAPLRAFDPLPATWSGQDAEGACCDLDTVFELAPMYVKQPPPAVPCAMRAFLKSLRASRRSQQW